MSSMLVEDEEAKNASSHFLLEKESKNFNRDIKKSLNDLAEDGDFSSDRSDDKTMILQESLIDLYLSVKIRSNEEV